MIALKQKLTNFPFREITTIDQLSKQNQHEYYIYKNILLLFINTNTTNTFSKDIYIQLHSFISKEASSSIYIILDKTSTYYAKALQLLLLIGFIREPYYNIIDMIPTNKLNEKHFILFKPSSSPHEEIEEVEF